MLQPSNIQRGKKRNLEFRKKRRKSRGRCTGCSHGCSVNMHKNWKVEYQRSSLIASSGISSGVSRRKKCSNPLPVAVVCFTKEPRSALLFPNCHPVFGNKITIKARVQRAVR